MNNLIILLAVIKTMIIMLFVVKLSSHIPLLSLIFRSKIIGITVFQSLYVMILSGRLNLNKMPYVGCFFIMIDDIVLRALQYYKKD